jgi:glycolate oxidase
MYANFVIFPWLVSIMRIADDLLRIARGDVLADDWSRKVYSVDASHYEINPEAIVFPADELDVQQLCQYSSSHNIPIAARGAGTGLLGQALCPGIILDFSKHMNKIIDVETDSVTVQPGVVKAVLDKELKKTNKFLPPDPASSNFCTIGGMISNNSGGIHCLGYGSTISFLEAINVVYANGQVGFASPTGYDDKMQKLKRLLSRHTQEIITSYPMVTKNSCGYRLDAAITNKFNPQKVFAASEGTLGIITSSKLRILDIPEYRSLLVLGFEDMLSAISVVPLILKFFPVALEMLDHSILRLNDTKTAGNGCLLLVEFVSNYSRYKAEASLKACKEELAGRSSVLESASDEPSITKIWMARKNALNSVMKLTLGSRKPVGLIEDTVVPPGALLEYATKLLQIYRENKLDYVVYGHVGDGNMHTRPLIDTTSVKDFDLMQRIARTVFSYAINRGGTITGEHGDGYARTEYIPMMYGKPIASIFSQVKKLFDPLFTLNPFKKVPMQ